MEGTILGFNAQCSLFSFRILLSATRLAGPYWALGMRPGRQSNTTKNSSIIDVVPSRPFSLETVTAPGKWEKSVPAYIVGFARIARHNVEKIDGSISSGDCLCLAG
ncbi:uncharacterized protein MCYG_01188 [Microsporum canis CBS 113480]|uniref:Uncharacterized protein n=1 Tax=Arthroderma otae (strain ATCC MYA-4605 / CBS 113480) TaxID=554155 RepID=C5FF06_ARTOC|nr:uncharacterized protein MCYG_01188 [Microsporum canis CBS 113480]EEQ28300.1 predicted protein [Microsporum canis CBS 113480]